MGGCGSGHPSGNLSDATRDDQKIPIWNYSLDISWLAAKGSWHDICL